MDFSVLEMLVLQFPSLLPDGFALPPLPYLLGLLAALAAVGYGLFQAKPTVEEAQILALVPWISVGAAGHVLFVIGGLPAVLEPLGGTPAVYLSTAAIAGAVWIISDKRSTEEQLPFILGGVGAVVLLPLVGAIVYNGAQQASLELFWPTVAVIASIPVTAGVWVLFKRIRPSDAAVTGAVGLLAVFGHVLDAVSTTVGIDILGFGERTPLSREIILFADSLPTAEFIGAGWLFIIVKVIIVCGVVALMAEYVDEEPTEGRLLLGFIAAVGLGPAVHNLLLFAATAGI